MTAEELLKKIGEFLDEAIDEETWEDRMEEDDDTNVNDMAGGNIDDAYAGGYDAGMKRFARKVKSLIYKNPVTTPDGLEDS